MLLTTLLLLQSSSLPTMQDVRFADCMELARSDAKSGIVYANEWAQEAGEGNDGYRTDICLATAYAADGKFSEAAQAFAAGAKQAETAKNTGAAKLWAQAGNAAIAAGQSSDAVRFLDAALMSTALLPKERAEALIDRARAYVADGQVDKAKADLNEVRRTSPEASLAWLLSATLARRTGALSDAQGYIKTAAALSPNDAAVALEAGNIAAAAGAYAIAREQWLQTIKIAPKSRQATTAKDQLQQLDEIEAEQANAPAATDRPQSR